jgi:hypothetical protein
MYMHIHPYTPIYIGISLRMQQIISCEFRDFKREREGRRKGRGGEGQYM